jgi:hypothetical protein
MDTLDYLNSQLPDRVRVLDVWQDFTSTEDGRSKLVARVMWRRDDTEEEIVSYVSVSILPSVSWVRDELLHKIRMLTNAY